MGNHEALDNNVCDRPHRRTVYFPLVMAIDNIANLGQVVEVQKFVDLNGQVQ